MSESIAPGEGPKVISHKVEYRVREVKRYILTRFEILEYENSTPQKISQSYGEFDDWRSADRTGRLVAMGERGSAWQETEIKFTDALDCTIRLNVDGTSESV